MSSLPLPPSRSSMMDIMTSTLGEKYDPAGGKVSLAEDDNVFIVSEKVSPLALRAGPPSLDSLSLSICIAAL